MPGTGSRVVLRGVAVAAALLVIFLAAACGGGASNSSGAAAGSAQTGGSAGASRSAAIESFGQEASPAERAVANQAVQEFQRAWIQGDSAAACSLMAASTKRNLAVFARQLKSQGCAGQARSVRSTMSARLLAKDEHIQVTGMRVAGTRGFILYRDGKGANLAMPITREGNAWRMGALVGTRLP